MGTSVLNFRLGIKFLWRNSWNISVKDYSRVLHQIYSSELYMRCISRKLGIIPERLHIKISAEKFRIELFYYYLIRTVYARKRVYRKRKTLLRKLRYFLKFLTENNIRRNIKHCIEIGSNRNYKGSIINFRSSKEGYMKIKGRVAKIWKGRFGREIGRFTLEDGRMIKDRFGRKTFSLIKNLNIIYSVMMNISLSKSLRRKYTLKVLLDRFIYFTRNGKFFRTIVNLNKVLCSHLRAKMDRYLYYKRFYKSKRFRNFMDLYYTLDIAIQPKSTGIFPSTVGEHLWSMRRRYSPFFSLPTVMFDYFSIVKFGKVFCGYRLRIGGKTKGRKKDRSSYFQISRKRLYLKTFSRTLSYSFSDMATPYGVLGGKLWFISN